MKNPKTLEEYRKAYDDAYIDAARQRAIEDAKRDVKRGSFLEAMGRGFERLAKGFGGGVVAALKGAGRMYTEGRARERPIWAGGHRPHYRPPRYASEPRPYTPHFEGATRQNYAAFDYRMHPFQQLVDHPLNILKKKEERHAS